MKNLFTLIFTLMFVVLTSSMTVKAQSPSYGLSKSPCTTNISAAPVIRGFRLGMTVNELNKLVPKPPNFRGLATRSIGYLSSVGDHEISISFVQDEAAIQYTRSNNVLESDKYEKKDVIEDAPGMYRFRKAAFRGIDTLNFVSFVIFKNKVTAMRFEYEPSTVYKSRMDFAKTIASSFGLLGDWESADYEAATLACDGFALHVQAGNERKFQIWDTGAQNEISRQKKAKDENDRKQATEKDAAFKP